MAHAPIKIKHITIPAVYAIHCFRNGVQRWSLWLLVFSHELIAGRDKSLPNRYGAISHTGVHHAKQVGLAGWIVAVNT